MAEGSAHAENIKIVLNKVSEGESVPDAPITLEDLGAKLQKTMLTIKGKYLAEDGHCVKYDELRQSKDFKDYVELAKQLNHVDLETSTLQQRKAFFISILVTEGLNLHTLSCIIVVCKSLTSD